MEQAKKDELCKHAFEKRKKGQILNVASKMAQYKRRYEDMNSVVMFKVSKTMLEQKIRSSLDMKET